MGKSHCHLRVEKWVEWTVLGRVVVTSSQVGDGVVSNVPEESEMGVIVSIKYNEINGLRYLHRILNSFAPSNIKYLKI